MKRILPSLREKKRYLAFEVVSKNKIDDFSVVSEAIFDSCLLFFGVFTMSKMGIIPLKERWNMEKQKGVIKVNNKYVNELKSVLSMVKTVNNREVIIRSVGISGMLKKVNEKFIARGG